MKPGQQILSTIEISCAEAVWVFAAHLYAVLMPLTLCVAVSRHWDYLVQTTHKPFLFYVGVGLLTAGSAFEVAQNSLDKWYLTNDTGSANGAGLCDFLFHWLVTAGQAACAIAIAGHHLWVVAIATSMLLVFPALYLYRIAHFAPLAISGLLVVSLAYLTFGDPIVFMQPVLMAVTIYFFTALLKTGAQVIHGFTTIAAASGLVLIAIIGVAAAVLWPVLMMLPASTRSIRRPEAPADVRISGEPSSRRFEGAHPAIVYQSTSEEGDINA
jgi:hypothetical protein